MRTREHPCAVGGHVCRQRSALGRQQAGRRRVSPPRAQGGRWAALQPRGGHTAAQELCLEDKGTSEATRPPVPQAGPPTEHTQERHRGTFRGQAKSCWGWGWGPGSRGGEGPRHTGALAVTDRARAPAPSQDPCEDSASLCSGVLSSWGVDPLSPAGVKAKPAQATWTVGPQPWQDI